MIYETLSTKVAHSTVRKFLLTHEIFFGIDWKRTLKINVNLNCETLRARVVNSGVRIFSLGAACMIIHERKAEYTISKIIRC